MRWKTEKEGAPLILAKTATRLSWKREFKEWLPNIVDAEACTSSPARSCRLSHSCAPGDGERAHTAAADQVLPLRGHGQPTEPEGTALSKAVIFSVLTEDEQSKFLQRSVPQGPQRRSAPRSCDNVEVSL